MEPHSQDGRTTTLLAIFTLLFGSIFSIVFTMAPWMYSAVMAVVLGLFKPARAVSGQWQAPAQTDFNSLTKVLNGEGVYGFIYNSSITPDEKYGTYNWCNMPHVRIQEYVKPSSEFELQYVEVVSYRILDNTM